MLDARDAAWSRQLQAMADTFSAALKASQQTKSAAIGWDFDVDYAQGGQTIKSIRALPITKTPKD